MICTPVGSIPEVLDDGRTALFVTPGDDRQHRRGDPHADRNAGTWGATLSDAGAALYERLFTMDAFARAVGHCTPR